MADFNRNNRGRSGGGRSFGTRSFGGNRSMGRPQGRPQMHQAICDSCKKECQLPFKPTGERPVYCRDCFAKNGDNDTRRSYSSNDRPTFNRQSENISTSSISKEQFEILNTKLDKVLQALQSATPTEPAPIAESTLVEKKKRASKKAA